MIKKYFNRQKFQVAHFGGRTIGLLEIEDLSIKSISETSFTVDLKYRYVIQDSHFSKIEYATSKIEKTAESYKIISFDRKR